MAETTKSKGGRPRKTAAAAQKAPENAEVKEIGIAVPEAPAAPVEAWSPYSPAPKEKQFGESEVQAMIAAAVADAVAKAVAQAQAQQVPQIVQVAADVERVQFLYMAEVADDNVYEVGPGGMYGRIVGKTGAFSVPKTDLSRVMDAMFRMMMERRWIVVLSGLTDEEREAYGVDYREGEVLDKRAFQKMVDLGDEILEIYPKLCKGHREMVAKRFYEAYMGGKYVKREIIVELNRMSREHGSENGDFSAIIEAMNAADLKK